MYASVRGVGRRREQLRSGTEFDQVAIEHERGGVADARGLLHVVGHDDQSAVLFK